MVKQKDFITGPCNTDNSQTDRYETWAEPHRQLIFYTAGNGFQRAGSKNNSFSALQILSERLYLLFQNQVFKQKCLSACFLSRNLPPTQLLRRGVRLGKEELGKRVSSSKSFQMHKSAALRGIKEVLSDPLFCPWEFSAISVTMAHTDAHIYVHTEKETICQR